MSLTTNVTTLPTGRVQIAATLPAADLAIHRDTALGKLREHTKIDGFRPGTASDDILIKHVGELAVTEAMAEEAIAAAYVSIIEEAKIDAIGRPQIVITKIAPESPLEFTIETDVMPSITIKDPQKIAAKIIKDQKVEPLKDEDVTAALTHLRRIRTHNELIAKHDDSSDAPAPKLSDITDEELMDLDDEFVQKLGEFKTVAEFTTHVKKNLTEEKEKEAAEKTRLAIVDALLEQANFVAPSALVDFELSKMRSQLEYDLGMSGMKVEDYLKHINKTEAELLETWRPDAGKRAQMQLLLNHIATKESIEPDAAAIQTELDQLKAQYGDVKDFNEDRARAYVEQVLLNKAVFDWLEKTK